MIRRRNLITALVGVFVVSAAVRADMLPVCAGDIGGSQPAHTCREVHVYPADSASVLDYTGVGGLEMRPVQLCPEAPIRPEQSLRTQPAQIQTDEQSSVGLCLSALVGLGLCTSAHSLKKLHFGFIPEWYHNGGPFQIGHSIAVSPDSICPVPVCSFEQPVWTAGDRVPQYCDGTIASLWRNSQFTPDVLASRGPP